MDTQALSLNNTIEKLNSNVLKMLSERGGQIYSKTENFSSIGTG